MDNGTPSIGVVIRFSNSAKTLPSVLDGLKRQTLQPDLVLGVNSHSADHSPVLLRQFGARIIDWTDPYNHSRVLNFGLRHCPTDLVLVLSSHTTLCSSEALARMADAMRDPTTACVSGTWDDDPYYSNCITWDELQAKGMKFASIYSNSFGMVRRALWEQIEFDETIGGMEDYAWALEWLKRGYVCRRITFPYRYERSGPERYGFFAGTAFKLADRHGLRIIWLGPRESFTNMLKCFVNQTLARKPDPQLQLHRERLWAWLTWRWKNSIIEPKRLLRILFPF